MSNGRGTICAQIPCNWRHNLLSHGFPDLSSVFFQLPRTRAIECYGGMSRGLTHCDDLTTRYTEELERYKATKEQWRFLCIYIYLDRPLDTIEKPSLYRHPDVATVIGCWCVFFAIREHKKVTEYPVQCPSLPLSGPLT